MMLKRIPGPALRPFVKILWVTHRPVGTGPLRAPRVGVTFPRAANQTDLVRVPSLARERVLPTGEMHLAFRLSDPLRLFATETDRTGVVLGHAVIGGVRSTFHLRDVSAPTWSLGVMLRPGASRALFGIPADEFAGCHVALEQVWGPTTSLLLERVSEMRNPQQQLDFIEEELTSRVASSDGVHPVVALGLDRLGCGIDVRSVVQSSGYSHRRFVELFKSDVGVPPKLHCRIRRFQRLLTRISRDANASWADLALSSGFSDQSHLSREFREFAGLTPREYRRVARDSAHHVPLGERE